MYPPEIRELLTKKLWASWALSRNIVAKGSENYGKIVNLHAAGQLFCRSIFYPTEFETSPSDVYTEIPQEDNLVLRQPLPISSQRKKVEPCKFVNEFRYHMTQRPNFAATYFPGAVEMVKHMLAFGPVALWTTGDHYGVPSLGLPGSKDQEWRLRSGGWFELKRYNPSLYTVSHENKMAQLPWIIDVFKRNHIDALVIVEDKVQNLLQAKQRIVEHHPGWGDFTYLIWDRQCEKSEDLFKHGSPKLPDGITAEEAVRKFDLIEVWDCKEIIDRATKAILQRETDLPAVGWIVDHDDVIANDKLRVAAQEEAVLQWLESSSWI